MFESMQFAIAEIAASYDGTTYRRIKTSPSGVEAG